MPEELKNAADNTAVLSHPGGRRSPRLRIKQNWRHQVTPRQSSLDTQLNSLGQLPVEQEKMVDALASFGAKMVLEP
jgi:hypothetical protein